MIDHALHDFAKTTCQCYWPIIIRICSIFSRFRDRDKYIVAEALAKALPAAPAGTQGRTILTDATDPLSLLGLDSVAAWGFAVGALGLTAAVGRSPCSPAGSLNGERSRQGEAKRRTVTVDGSLPPASTSVPRDGQ